MKNESYIDVLAGLLVVFLITFFVPGMDFFKFNYRQSAPVRKISASSHEQYQVASELSVFEDVVLSTDNARGTRPVLGYTSPSKTTTPPSKPTTNCAGVPISALQKDPESSPPVLSARSITYAVKGGDTLWDIAERYTGSGFNWTEIAEDNDLEDPGTIHVGTVLSLDISPENISYNTSR